MSKGLARAQGGVTFVELFRLALVVLGTGGAFEISDRFSLEPTGRLVVTALGAGGAYVLGGIIGRLLLRRVTTVEASIERVPTSEILAGMAGGVVGVVTAASLLWPVFLFGAKIYTVPIAVALVATTGWAGSRIGRSRAGDLMLYLGAGGRMPRGTRAQGRSYKLVDTSALIDGRILQICRDGWLDGVLLLATSVLYELQGLADSSDPDRRARGQRGLDTASALEGLSTIAVEVLEDPGRGDDDVDTRLIAIASERGTTLITTDANLTRVARLQGVAVRNVRELAETLRPPVVPGEHLEVLVTKEGREAGQGVGFLPDGTMVVVEGGATMISETALVEITSVMSTSHGRMLFGTSEGIAGDDRPRPSGRDGGAAEAVDPPSRAGSEPGR